MKIESQVTEMIPGLPAGNRAKYVSGQQNSFTSDPIGNSSEETGSASETAGSGFATQAQPDPVNLRNAVEKLNEIIQSHKTDVSFSVDEETDETVIRVFKTETGELIRQFPPEEILAMKAKLGQLTGWLYDTTV